MMKSLASMVALSLFALAMPAMADFSGQTILGPLGPDSSVDGDNTGASDDNDGWFSGDHIFDVWDGGDDVWQLDWPGGPLIIELTYDNFFTDPDLFLYTPGSLDESSYDSYTFDTDVVSVPGAGPGTYYVLIDTTAGNEGAYHLNISPEPTTAGLLGLGLLALVRRRRAA